MSDENNIYWDYNKTMTYNALFNFIIGNRGGGKTYGAKKFAINRFLKKGEQFMYVRRYKEELKKKKQFFNDIAQEFPEHEFKVDNFEAIIDKETAGYFMPLSTSKIEKSVSFPEVTTIIYDEFILDKGTYHYLRDEVTHFLDLFETVARNRDNVRVLFLSNAITVTNPYFLYFNIHMPKAGKFFNFDKKRNILVELVQNEKFIEMKKNTRFGQLIAGTEYGNYAIENTFLRDDDSFVEKKTGRCAFMLGYSYKGKKYGIWKSLDTAKIYVSYDTQEVQFALTLKDMSVDRVLFTKLSKTPFWFMERAFKVAELYFEDINIKNTTLEIIKLYFQFKNL